MDNNEAIKRFLEVVIIDIKRTMEDKDLNASGGTANSLEIVDNTLVGSDAFYYLEFGRAPGAMPPVDTIEGWLKSRGLNGYSPWAVAKSIADKGTRIYRNKNLGFSISAIATKYAPELLKDIVQGMSDRFNNEIKLKK